MRILIVGTRGVVSYNFYHCNGGLSIPVTTLCMSFCRVTSTSATQKHLTPSSNESMLATPLKVPHKISVKPRRKDVFASSLPIYALYVAASKQDYTAV